MRSESKREVRLVGNRCHLPERDGKGKREEEERGEVRGGKKTYSVLRQPRIRATIPL